MKYQIEPVIKKPTSKFQILRHIGTPKKQVAEDGKITVQPMNPACGKNQVIKASEMNILK